VKRQRSEFVIIIGLLGLGVVLYALRWMLFPGPTLHNEMWRFLVGDVAFLVLQIALVTLLVDRMIRAREKQSMLRKLNMVIGAFFSELGTELLGRLAVADANLDEVRPSLIPAHGWTERSYAEAGVALRAHHVDIELSACDLDSLKVLLKAEKPFLLNLLGNQTLLEHEAFTELLWAVTHLAEELEARTSFVDIPTPDRIHLAGDVKRAYTLLVLQWLEYVRHLQMQYPYLFSLAVRVNPLDPTAHATVTE
jgi:hypothetical protein